MAKIPSSIIDCGTDSCKWNEDGTCWKEIIEISNRSCVSFSKKVHINKHSLHEYEELLVIEEHVRKSFMAFKELRLSRYTLQELIEISANNDVLSIRGFTTDGKNITGLGLAQCYLISLPDCIKNFSELRYLCLIDNSLKALPESIGHLKNLQVLDLRFNDLSALPESIVNLTNLRYLNFAFTCFPKNAVQYFPTPQKDWIHTLKENGCIVGKIQHFPRHYKRSCT